MCEETNDAFHVHPWHIPHLMATDTIVRWQDNGIVRQLDVLLAML
jgi:hypothetical protein